MAPVLVCALAVALLLVAEWRDSAPGRWLTKPIAALAFLWFAASGAAFESSYGRLLFAGLVLCAAGDVLLIPSARPAWFRAGVGMFGLGHLAYAAAFLTQPSSAAALGFAALLLAAAAGATYRWLAPHLPPDLVWPVRAYFGVIASMAALACSVTAAGGSLAIAAGALGFALSDVSVARGQFRGAGFANKAWGMPLYFGSQLLLASTV